MSSREPLVEAGTLQPCLQEWTGFVDRLHGLARASEPPFRYEILALVGALRIRVAHCAARLNRMKLVNGPQRARLNRELVRCVAELTRITHEKRARWESRFAAETWIAVRQLLEIMPALLPTCGEQAEPAEPAAAHDAADH